MASLDSPNSPPNPSFAIRETAAHKFLRSISTEEAPSFSHFHYSPPPRRSTHSSIHTSPIFSSPPRQDSCSPADHPVTSTESAYTYRCLSSVLKRDGHILSIAMSSNIIYSGSSTNIIRLWKLPEFSECGQLKTRARMVVALQASHDRVYAAYADGKIRIWRRTWDGAFKHIRLATIPSSGCHVRSLIARKDMMVISFRYISMISFMLHGLWRYTELNIM
ncbi:hypothetical protein OIU77_027751 [Salix suchowensis]|uniref:Uncharacterized protein n=1 Tax=Salix suchowensis TaxID=1278906 RepID=A0ABQ9BQQ1_9ROSI|nr:hypothetical protein OIU77_027751 [Salix suchowensis]